MALINPPSYHSAPLMERSDLTFREVQSFEFLHGNNQTRSLMFKNLFLKSVLREVKKFQWDLRENLR